MQPLHQQGDAVEGLAAVVGGVAGQLMDLVDALVQSAGDIRLLADGLGNLVAGMGDPASMRLIWLSTSAVVPTCCWQRSEVWAPWLMPSAS